MTLLRQITLSAHKYSVHRKGGFLQNLHRQNFPGLRNLKGVSHSPSGEEVEGEVKENGEEEVEEDKEMEDEDEDEETKTKTTRTKMMMNIMASLLNISL